MKPLHTLIASIALVSALAASAVVAPAAPAQAFPTIVIPTCKQLFSKNTWSALFPPGMLLSTNTVRTGASNARQAEIINTNLHRNCTWTDAWRMRSITVSVAVIDNVEEREIRAWYAANGIPLRSLGGGDADFAFIPHKAPRMEEHFTGDMFFIAIDDRSFGSLGATMQDAYETVLRLNPWMLTI